MKPRLGKALLEEGLVTELQLGDALEAQVVHGGRLGSNLVELGYLSPDALAGALARHHGLRVVAEAELLSALPGLPRVVKRELLQQLQGIPLRLEGRTLHVAVIDPTNVGAVDKVQFATGLRLQLYVVAEGLFWSFAERHLGLARPGFKRPPLERRLRARAAPRPAPAPAPQPQVELDLGELGPEFSAAVPQPEPSVEIDLELEPASPPPRPSLGELPAAAPTWQTGVNAAPPAGTFSGTGGDDGYEEEPERDDGYVDDGAGGVEVELEPEPLELAELGTEVEVTPFAEILALLERSEDRYQVAAALRRYARSRTERMVLFVLRAGAARGFAGEGPGLPERVARLSVPVEESSALERALATRLPYIGPPLPGSATESFHGWLGAPVPTEVVVIPIRLDARVVNLLYLDNGSASVDQHVKLDVLRLARACTAAYERLLAGARAEL